MSGISIIIPVYNGEKYIEKCISMLKAQDFSKEDEIIFVNDGSTDNTFNLLNTSTSPLPNCTIHSQTNMGLSAARNVGLSLVHNEWVVFQDVDDCFDNMFVKCAHQAISQSQNAEMIVFATYSHKSSKEHNFYISDNLRLVKIALRYIQDELVDDDFVLYTAHNKLYKKDFIDKNKLTFTSGFRLGEDVVFNSRAYSLVSKVYFVREKHFEYVQNDMSLTHTSKLEDTKQMVLFEAALLNSLSECIFEKDIKNAFNYNAFKQWEICISTSLKDYKRKEPLFQAYKRIKDAVTDPVFSDILSSYSSLTIAPSKKIWVKALLLSRFTFLFTLLTRIH